MQVGGIGRKRLGCFVDLLRRTADANGSFPCLSSSILISDQQGSDHRPTYRRRCIAACFNDGLVGERDVGQESYDWISFLPRCDQRPANTRQGYSRSALHAGKQESGLPCRLATPHPLLVVWMKIFGATRLHADLEARERKDGRRPGLNKPRAAAKAVKKA